MTARTRQVDVCICAYARRDGLLRLLQSLTAQVGAPEFRVLIADNHAQPTVAAWLATDAQAWPFEWHVLHAPQSNIAVARNALLDAATTYRRRLRPRRHAAPHAGFGAASPLPRTPASPPTRHTPRIWPRRRKSWGCAPARASATSVRAHGPRPDCVASVPPRCCVAHRPARRPTHARTA